MANLLYKEEVYDIIGVCMTVYNTLGFGFLEIVYKDAMEIEFLENEMNNTREREFPIIYKGTKLKRSFFSDYLLFDKIVVEVKTNPDGITEDALHKRLTTSKLRAIELVLSLTSAKESSITNDLFCK